MWKLFDGHGLIAKPALICAGIAVGALPVIPIAAFGDPLGWKIVGALPLAVSAHILFLARRMLFPSWRDGLRSIAIGTGVALIPLSVIALNPFQTADNTLRNQKGLWEKAAPSGYEFTIQLSGWVEPEALSPKRVTVENGDVVAAVYISPRHSAGDPAPMEGLWTIERAFAELSAAKERGWRVSARFDEHWGFVERAFVDANEPSSSWDLEIRDFQVVQD